MAREEGERRSLALGVKTLKGPIGIGIIGRGHIIRHARRLWLLFGSKGRRLTPSMGKGSFFIKGCATCTLRSTTPRSPRKSYSVSLLLTLFFWSSKYDRDDEKDPAQGEMLSFSQPHKPNNPRRLEIWMVSEPTFALNWGHSCLVEAIVASRHIDIPGPGKRCRGGAASADLLVAIDFKITELALRPNLPARHRERLNLLLQEMEHDG